MSIDQCSTEVRSLVEFHRYAYYNYKRQDIGRMVNTLGDGINIQNELSSGKQGDMS